MCIVIDVNSISSVFKRTDKSHHVFAPVRSWIIDGNGIMLCGGTTYLNELKKMKKYIGFLVQLKKAGKLLTYPDANEINRKEEELKKLCADKDFDDPHIAALLIVSGCRLLCSKDHRSFPYVTNKLWYSKKASIPKIYCDKSKAKAKVILTDKNIADVCKPSFKLNKKVAKNLKYKG